jgi:hypothetical protein
MRISIIYIATCVPLKLQTINRSERDWVNQVLWVWIHSWADSRDYDIPIYSIIIYHVCWYLTICEDILIYSNIQDRDLPNNIWRHKQKRGFLISLFPKQTMFFGFHIAQHMAASPSICIPPTSPARRAWANPRAKLFITTRVWCSDGNRLQLNPKLLLPQDIHIGADHWFQDAHKNNSHRILAISFGS